MKLVLYFFSLHKSAGGAERTMLGLADAMRVRGHRVQLVSWDEPTAESFYPIPEQIRWNRLGAGSTPLGKMRRVVRLTRLLRQERPDLFVGFVMGGDKSVYTANLIAGVPVVAAERSSPAMYRVRLPAIKVWFYSQLFGLCRGVAVQFESYRRGYPRRLRNRIAVIPNPVEAATVQATPARNTGRKTLLAVGRLSHEKGFDVLVDAFHSIASDFPDWNLRILGEGPDRRALEGMIDGCGLGDRVQLPGTASDLSAAYADAQLFVQPSRWEGFPNALAEALAHGLPAVGFADCAGVNELIVNGVNGLCAPGVGDARSLASALAVLMGDAARRETMGRQANSAMGAYAPHSLYDRWETFLLDCSRTTYNRGENA